MALSFESARPTWNVDIDGSTLWTATGNAGQPITWTATPPDVVSLTPQGTNNVECVIRALKLGQAQITITAPNVASTYRIILVGGLLAYGPDGQLYGTYAVDWVPVSAAEGIPTAQAMKDNSYGFAFVPPTQWTDTSFNVTCYLISLQTMTALVPPSTTTSQASVNQAAVDYKGPITPGLVPSNVREVTVAATGHLVDTGVEVGAGDQVTVQALSGRR